MSFDSPDLSLGLLLQDVAKGKVQLPDFQREWKWDDDRIKSLLASVGRGHPIGVLMMLETGGDGAAFAPTLLAGVDPAKAGPPDQLLLDGQQRLTSLYQSLMSNTPVNTTDPRGKKIRRWYYVDIGTALRDNGDLEDAVLSIPEDRVVRDQFGRNIERDYSTIEAECANEAFPLSVVFDYSRLTDWQIRYLSVDGSDAARRLERWKQFNEIVLKNFIGYTVPAIVLKKDTPKEAVCTVFEKVNTGGVPLNVFELMTATFAADGFRLKDDWIKQRTRMIKDRPVLQAVENTDFLQVVSLLATQARKRRHEKAGLPGQAPGIGCKRKDILRLTKDEYVEWADSATIGLEWASEFLNQEFIFRAQDLPYKTQLVPLAALRVLLGKDIDQHATHGLVRRWYWSGVLGELYGGSTETRFARDIEQIPEWITSHGPQPGSLGEAAFREQRLLSLHTRNSAAYKGIYALLMRNGSLDWLKHQSMSLASFFSYQVDIHHIFPKSWCMKNEIDHARQESIVNKTAISRITNIKIGGRSPAVYVPYLEKEGGISSPELDAIIATHEIDPAFLRTASFDAFFRARADALLALIEEAMGKAPIRDQLADEAEDAFEDDDDVDADDQLLIDLSNALASDESGAAPDSPA